MAPADVSMTSSAVAVVISDMRMPQMDGATFCTKW
jgi:CheY-like chemotaxis protein